MKAEINTEKQKTIFIVPGNPQGKARARTVRIGNGVRTYTPAETANYENYIKVCFKQADKTFFSDKPLKVQITAFFQIPQSWSLNKALKAANGEIKPTVKPDGDNVLKVVADALNGVAYTDDKNIIEAHVYKVYAASPMLQIALEEV